MPSSLPSNRLLIILLAVYTLVGTLNAQVQKKEITIPLNPIAIENGKYYFNGNRTTFDGLLVPLQALNDEQVNRSVKTVFALRTANNVLNLAFFAYFLYLTADQHTYLSYTQART